MHKLLAKQLERARTPDGATDWPRLLEMVSAAYEEADSDRRRTDRSIGLMVEENDELNAELAQTVERLLEAQRIGKIGDWTYEIDTTELWWAPEVHELLRYDPTGFRPTRESVLKLLVSDSADRLLTSQSAAMDSPSSVSVDVKIICGDGEIGDFALTSKAVKGSDGRVARFVGTIQDIAERKRAEEQLEQLAYFDPLTGLANRALFRRKLKEVLGRREGGPRGALLLLDLDRFKEVNDSLGHTAGDEVLANVANIVAGALSKGHFLARLGGDEFAIILPDCDDADTVAYLADKVIDAICGPMKLSNGEATIGTSISVALYPDHGADADELQRNADLALYRAKEDGRNRYQLFRPDMSEALLHKLALARDLRRAIANDTGLEVHYQPQVDLATGRVTGFEALTRWNHPTRGYVSPLEFIPIAESSSLIAELDVWVLRESVAQAKAWLDAGEPPREIAVNVSAAQIWHSDLERDVSKILSETGLPGHLLCLELTESLFADHSEALVRNVLAGLKRRGVKLALDDFGTGFSSLGYLTKLPFDKLKIDRVFVDGIMHLPRRRQILKGMIALARGLRMTTVAEGAEHDKEVDILRDYGCDQVQGFVFARPAVAAMALATAHALEERPASGETEPGKKAAGQAA